MDDDTEVLDWTNEDDEEPEMPLRGPSLEPHSGLDNDPADDDGEDAISLGDEDEHQGFYDETRIDAPCLPNSTFVEENRLASPSSTKLDPDTFGANGHATQQSSPKVVREHQRTPSIASSVAKELSSPQKSGRGQTSPSQRSSQTRVYHALPPKPVPIAVPPLPPSHPSITAATSMTTVSPRTAIREPMKTISSVATPAPNGSSADLPQDWETRTSKTTGEIYYYNCVTDKSSWTIPVSGSKTDSFIKDSLDHDMEDTTRPALVTTRIDRVELTNEDRYYRPGTGSSTSLSLEARAGRLEISSGLSASQARKERSPVSPRRKRARSNSPIAIRVAEPSLERESVSSRSGRRKARADAAASRLANNYIPERDQLVRRRSVSPRNFSQPNDNDRLFRRGHDEDLMQVDHFDQRPGRLLGKQEDDNREYRGRSRDRDYPQAYDRRPDSREPPYRTYQSSQRSRSPPPRTDTRYADRGREPEPREQEQERWDRDAQQNRRHADPAPPSRYREISPRPVPELSSRSGRDREVHSSRYERRDLSPPHLANETAFTKQEAAVQPRQQNRDRPSGMDSYRPRYEEDIHQTAVRDQSPPRSYGRDVDRGRQDAPSKDNRYRPEPLQIPIPEASREEIPSPPQQLAPAPPRRGAPLPPQHASFRQRAISQQSASSTRNLPAKELSPQGANKHLSPSSPVQSFGSRALPTLGSSSETRIADRHGHSLNDRHYSPERPHGQEIENGRQTAGLGSSRAANAPRIEEPSRSGPDRRALPPTGPATERREGHPRPLPERTSSKRRRGGKLTGTNDIRIANRRTGFNLAVATPQLAPQHLGSGNQSTPPVFNTRVPTGPREQAPSKSSYERPLDQPSVDHAPRGGRPNRAERNRSRVEPESKLQDDRGRVRDRPLHPMTAPSLSVNGLSSRDATAPPLSREDSVFSSTLDESSARQSADEKELQPPRSSLNGYDSALGSINRTSPQQLRPMPTTPPEPERQSTLEYPLSPSLQRRLSMSGDPLPPRLRKAIPSPEPKKTRPEDLSAPPEDRSSFLERVERPASLRRSESLLDRMNSDDPSRRGMDNSATSPSQSLRERMVPTKRDHDEMRAESRYTGADRPYDADDGHEMKRSRKRSGKPRRIPHTVGGGGGGRRYGP